MKWADVNGAALRYDVSGAGPPLVLLHEMGGTLESWNDVVPLLPGRRVLRMDLRGAGLSQKIWGTADIDDFVRDLGALIDLAELPGPVAMAGVAVGAAIGLRFAARNPSRVAAFVAMAPATGLPPDRVAATLELADRFEREGVRSRILERIDHSFPACYRTDSARFAAFVGRACANDPRSYAAIHRMLAGMNLDDDLPRIACPTLVLAGATDQTRPAAVVRKVAEQIPGTVFREIASGHVMPMLTPELVAHEINQFLDGDKISSLPPAKLV